MAATPSTLYTSSHSSSEPLAQYPSQNSLPSTDTSQNPDSVDSDLSQSSLSSVSPDPDFHHPKVLISIALKEDQILSTSQWAEWLESVPAITRFTQVEGVYKSDSAYMLLSLPVAIWDLLPKDRAVNFLAFVKSSNLLIPQNHSSGRTEAADFQSYTANIRKARRYDNTHFEIMHEDDPYIPTIEEPQSTLHFQNQNFEKENVAEMKPPSTSNRTKRPWAPEEEQRLQAMRDAGVNWEEIAKV